MARVIWKQGAVVSVWVKHDVRVLAQMLRSPYLTFFKAFSQDEQWPDSLDQVPQLFCCAVTRQFLKYSRLKKVKHVSPSASLDIPKYWIKSIPGSRQVTLWKGTPDEVSFVSLEDKPGGSLVEFDILEGGFEEYPVIKESIDLDDAETIDKYELNVVHIFPGLNQRLYYCFKEDRNVDPDKDLKFDRPVSTKYKTLVDIWAFRGNLEDWGYSAAPH